jgi:hypothetical protein
MKFDIFSRKKFKCITCGDKFKTETEQSSIAEESTLGNADCWFVCLFHKGKRKANRVETIAYFSI